MASVSPSKSADPQPIFTIESDESFSEESEESDEITPILSEYNRPNWRKRMCAKMSALFKRKPKVEVYEDDIDVFL